MLVEVLVSSKSILPAPQMSSPYQLGISDPTTKLQQHFLLNLYFGNKPNPKAVAQHPSSSPSDGSGIARAFRKGNVKKLPPGYPRDCGEDPA